MLSLCGKMTMWDVECVNVCVRLYPGIMWQCTHRHIECFSLFNATQILCFDHILTSLVCESIISTVI